MSPKMSAVGGIVLLLTAIGAWLLFGQLLKSRGEEGQLLAAILGMWIAILPDLYQRATRAPGTFVQKFLWPSMGFRIRRLPLWVVGLMLAGAALARWFRIGIA